MRRKYFLAFVNCIFWTLECNAKYLISVNDSVSVQNCDLDGVKNISLLHANPEEIIFRNCHIEELPNALFLRFHKLRVLEITESQLRAVSDFSFTGAVSLQLLNLSRNNLTTVKTWSNDVLGGLQWLDLRRNAISSIHKFAFKNYPNLLKLNLAVNHISDIPDELFRSTPLLKHLNLGKNDLKSIDSHTFKHLHKLLHLELKHNQIDVIDAEAFVGCTHMKTLHLQENLIKSFDRELISNMPRLLHLNLSQNLIESFSDETFAKNQELETLDISFNGLKEFDEFTFKGLEVLSVLNASHNSIKYVENEMFTSFANLKYLDLSNNQISFLPDKVFASMSLLRSIKLNNNSVKSIDDAVLLNLKLRHFDLSCNRLSSDNFLWPSVEIKYLNLTYNAFTEINASLLDNTVADLWGNPFDCEWLMKEILASKNIRLGENYVLASKQNVLQVGGIKCFEGNETEHKLIVIESKVDLSEEVENHLEKHYNIEKTVATQPELFDYRSILLWLLYGVLGVFTGLRFLKCLLTKSERQSEQYRLSRQQAYLIDEDLKNSAVLK